MSNYIQDPNDSKKQIPGPPPDNYYDRVSFPSANTFVKTPNHVFIAAASDGVGFSFRSSASFAQNIHSSSLTTHFMQSSSNYHNFGLLTAGTKLDIHPTSWSGSKADSDAGTIVMFVYKGGLDGQGRP